MELEVPFDGILFFQLQYLINCMIVADDSLGEKTRKPVFNQMGCYLILPQTLKVS